MTSWTTPRTWVTGEVLSSSNFNTHIRDNMIYYGGTDSLSTTPPASPGNGQYWTLPVGAVPDTYWTFRWITALSAWLFVGGGWWTTIVAAAQGTASTTYVGLGTALSVTVPRAGDYNISHGHVLSPSISMNAYSTVKLGAAAAADAELAGGNASSGTDIESRTRFMKRTLAASDSLVHQYKTNTGTATFSERHISIQPIKVT